MQFHIEQIAICPRDPCAAKKLLCEMGAGEWAEDIVVARGTVRNETSATNVAELSFDYKLGANEGNPLEFEVLSYQVGSNWMENAAPRVSHLGMHCTEADLRSWRVFFERRGIRVAQEVKTRSHSNPHIAGRRWYHYVIFDTHAILGVDIKFIVRRDEL